MLLMYLTTLTFLLVLLPWHHAEAAVEQDPSRTNYCIRILGQTEEQCRDCAAAPSARVSNGNRPALDRAVFHLLCCLGTFATHKVTTDYTQFMDKTLIAFIFRNVMSLAHEERMAVYIRKCYKDTLLTGLKLSENDYYGSLSAPYSCQVNSSQGRK